MILGEYCMMKKCGGGCQYYKEGYCTLVDEYKREGEECPYRIEL